MRGCGVQVAEIRQKKYIPINRMRLVTQKTDKALGPFLPLLQWLKSSESNNISHLSEDLLHSLADFFLRPLSMSMSHKFYAKGSNVIYWYLLRR